ncbi:MAG: CrcB family protein [Sporichthyaceae bacterium]
MTWALVAIGGAVGAACRYLVDVAVTARFGDRLPWGTLTVNLLGSAAFGLLIGLSAATPDDVVTLLGVGFCGAFTTVSALAWETVALVERGTPSRAVATLGLSVVGGLGLAAAGLAIGLSISA